MTFVPQRKKLLTPPVFKLVENQPRYVKITGPMHLGKAEKEGSVGKDGKKSEKRDPATLAPCINLEDGAEGQIIVAAVVKSTLEDEYPGEGYVGKCFSITKGQRQPGKQYFPYLVEEIEDPAAPARLDTRVKAK